MHITRLESGFNKIFKARLAEEFPGSFLLKTNANDLPGFPDRIFLWNNHWAAFESKRFLGAIKQPNQDYYIRLLNKMSFGTFVNPDNMEDVIDAIQHAFRP